MDTTRRHPRTMAEAFKGPEYGAAIEKPAPYYPVIWWLCLIAIGLVSAAAIWVTR